MLTLLRALLCATLLPALASAETIACKVVGVSDGDTLTCLTAAKVQIKVRLAEVDTPEKAQPYGQKAKQTLSDLAFGKQATLDVQSRDRYGRSVALANVAGVDVNRELVRRGAAWVYRQYSKDSSLLRVEAEAKAARRGLWALSEADIVPPWDWRKAGKGLGAQVASAKAGSASAGGFTCGAKRYCKQMASCAEAMFHLACGVRSLDGNGDGVPCEAVCR